MQVEFLAPAVVAGRRMVKGARVEVDDSSARSLIRLGLARKVTRRKKEAPDGS